MMAENKILQGAREAIAVARGDEPAARITLNGHAYVPESNVDPDIRHLTNLLDTIARLTQAGHRNMDQMVRDMDRACDCARTALKILRDR